MKSQLRQIDAGGTLPACLFMCAFCELVNALWRRRKTGVGSFSLTSPWVHQTERGKREERGDGEMNKGKKGSGKSEGGVKTGRKCGIMKGGMRRRMRGRQGEESSAVDQRLLQQQLQPNRQSSPNLGCFHVADLFESQRNNKKKV